MKRIEIIIWLFAALAFVIRIFHFPRNGMLTVLSLSTLFVFFYLSFLLVNGIRFRDIFKGEAYKDTNTKRIIGAIGFGFAFSTIVIAELFKRSLANHQNEEIRQELMEMRRNMDLEDRNVENKAAE